jgi:predicted GNAT superfamily acetyltransferase
MATSPAGRIRPAAAADLPKVHAINESFVPRVGKEDLFWFEKYLRLADVFWVYERDNDVLGYFVAMRPHCDYKSENFLWFKKRYDEFLYVDRLAVEARAHGQGIGRAFYQKLAEERRGMVPRITCEVNVRPPNPESYLFHQKIGFREVGQQETKGGTIRVAMLEWLL